MAGIVVTENDFRVLDQLEAGYVEQEEKEDVLTERLKRSMVNLVEKVVEEERGEAYTKPFLFLWCCTLNRNLFTCYSVSKRSVHEVAVYTARTAFVFTNMLMMGLAIVWFKENGHLLDTLSLSPCHGLATSAVGDLTAPNITSINGTSAPAKPVTAPTVKSLLYLFGLTLYDNLEIATG